MSISEQLMRISYCETLKAAVQSGSVDPNPSMHQQTMQGIIVPL